jgi:hypothetical protein
MMKKVIITSVVIKRIVHFEFISEDQSSKLYYMEVLKLLHEAVRRKKPELWPNDWILHHDSVAAIHKALSVAQNRFLKWNTLLVLLNLLRMTFGCSQK